MFLLIAVLGFWREQPAAGSALSQPVPNNVPRTLSLAGEWRFLLDAEDRGLRERFWQIPLPDRIRLPGCVASTQGREPQSHMPNKADDARENADVPYVGPAWFQRTITIPYAWRRRRITLYLERCCWESRVWLNNTPVGARDSLSTPHVYDLTPHVQPGTFRLTIRVDNRLKLDLGPAMACGGPAQKPWNGIVGRIELRGTARVWMEEQQVYPEPAQKRLRVRTRVGNMTGRPVRITIQHTGTPSNPDAPTLRFATRGSAPEGLTWLETSVPLPPDATLWDTWRPRVYGLESSLEATDGRTTWLHNYRTSFGLRQLTGAQGGIQINGFPFFLRGVVLKPPKSGFGTPPMERAAWHRILGPLAASGVNHVRFHTWCPPEAAFEVADELGLLLHVEAPASARDLQRMPEVANYLGEEAARICASYGNHPSFGLFTLGCELLGDTKRAEELVQKLRSEDRRHLYAASSGGLGTNVDEFWTVPVPVNLLVSGEWQRADGASEPPVPILAHELGQTPARLWDELRIRAGDVAAVQDSVSGYFRDLLSRALAAIMLSGRLAGYQLAPSAVGLLSPHNASTSSRMRPGSDTPAHGVGAWFKGTVLLAEFDKRVLSTRDTLRAELYLIHYGPSPLEAHRLRWTLRRGDQVMASGNMESRGAEPCQVARVGQVEYSLREVSVPARLVLRAEIEGSDISNDWTVYVYSPEDEGPFAEGVYVTRVLSRDVLERLRRGERVVLLPDSRVLRWSVPVALWEQSTAGLVGPALTLRCDAEHPAFQGFPTPAWADVQWHDMMLRSRGAVLPADMSAEGILAEALMLEPERRVALIAEYRVGPGRLLVCTLDVLGDNADRHEARQLLKSLLDYASSPAFEPQQNLSEEELARFVRLESSWNPYAATPPDIEQADLYARAGGIKEEPNDVPWRRELDIVVERGQGLSYRVEGIVTGKAQDGAWLAEKPILLQLEPKQDLSYTLWLRFAAHETVIAHVEIGQEAHETVEVRGGRPVWFAFPLPRNGTAESPHAVRITPEQGRLRVLDLVVLPANGG